MVEWSRRRRLLVAGTVGLATCALVVLPGGASQAVGPYHFQCSGPLADGKTVAASVTLSSKELAVGRQLVIDWQLGDAQSPLKVPDAMDPNHDKGGHLAVTARVHASGIWTGQGDIDSVGTRLVPAERLRDGRPLELGEVQPGLATAERAGSGTIEVKELVLDLAPVESTWNDNFTPVGDFQSQYGAGWSPVSDPAEYDGKTHFEQDFHEADKEGEKASFTFVGTGVDLITDKESTMSEFELVTGDGHPGAEATETYNAYWSVLGQRRVGEVFKAASALPYGKYTLTVTNKTDGKFARIDAFRVHADTSNNLARSPYHTVCTPTGSVLIPIKVTDGGGGGGASGSASPDPSGTGTPSPGTPSPGSSPSPSAGPSDATHTGLLTSVLVKGSPTPTATVTVTAPPTPTVAQVKVIPKGGAPTGVAPARSASGVVLIGSGSVLLLASLFIGVAHRRRGAAHAGRRSEHGLRG